MPSSSGSEASEVVALPRGRKQDVAAGDAGPLGLFTTLARTGLFLDALQRECLGDHGLAFKEYSVLRLLQRAPHRHLAPSVLAEEIVCTTGAMTKLVDRLQRAGLVERAPDPNDRRGVLVRITTVGNRRANEASRTYQAGRQNVLDRLDAREAEQIHSSLQRLLEALETNRSEK
jgi:DNA-binding MarR family transcriptional regulator